jgi:hypothetical protein
MIHADLGSMKRIKRLDGRGIHGTGAYAKTLMEGSQSFVMILIAFPEDQADGLLNTLTYRG